MPGTAAGTPSLPPGLRILLVDDDEFITDMLPRKMRRAFPGLDISTASTPDEGLRLASALAPHVVLSDYNLRASMNGLEMLDETARRLPDSVRILISAHTRREIGPALEGARIHGMLEKPMKLDDLLGPLADAIREALGDLGAR